MNLERNDKKSQSENKTQQRSGSIGSTNTSVQTPASDRALLQLSKVIEKSENNNVKEKLPKKSSQDQDAIRSLAKYISKQATYEDYEEWVY